MRGSPGPCVLESKVLKGGLYRGLYRGYIGIMEKKMETSI